jgi:hypothetical protein
MIVTIDIDLDDDPRVLYAVPDSDDYLPKDYRHAQRLLSMSKIALLPPAMPRQGNDGNTPDAAAGPGEAGREE